MKKIYLFSIAFLAFFVGAVAQPTTCPPGLNVVAWRLVVPPIGASAPHCVVTVNSSIEETGWTMALIAFNGSQIPGWNGSPSEVPISAGTGSASIAYDCNNIVSEVEYVQIKRIVPGEDPIICEVIPTAGTITPVKLTSFNGRLQNDNSVALDWTSAIEIESYKYEVERSADGKYFDNVGNLDAAGNSATTLRYTFKDQLPAAGAYFYRLKQIDADGSFEYSKVVYVNSKKGAGTITKVFPNPFQNTIQLVGATTADLTPANVQVSSIAGQRINYKVIGNSISIDPSAPAGLYLVKVKGQVFN